MKLHQILKESKYRDEEIMFFEQYSKNHAMSPENEYDTPEDTPKDNDYDTKKDTKKIEPKKPVNSKPDTGKVKFKDKHDVTASEKIAKPSVYQDIINYGAYMGEGLYTISDYEFNHDLSTTDTDIKNINRGRLDDNPVFFNNILYNVINKLKLISKHPQDIERFLNVDPNHFWKGGAIHCIIYDSFNDNIMFYYADPSVDRYAHVIKKEFDRATFSRRQEKVKDDELTDKQSDLIEYSMSLGDQYIDHFKNSPKSRTTNLLRYKLLYSLGITMNYLPPAETK